MSGPRPRLHLPFVHWPPTDRLLWHDAAKNDDPFSDAAGTRLAKTTLHKLWMGWRRFLASGDDRGNGITGNVVRYVSSMMPETEKG